MIRNGIAYNEDLPWIFNVERAADVFLWDQFNKRYIDFTSGWNVANLGWNNPEIATAIIEQLQRNQYAPMWTSESIQESYAQELTKILPAALNTACRVVTGTEANEMAISIARAATGRKKIIGFINSYHGHSLATMALSFTSKDMEIIGPIPSDFVQIPFPAKTLDASNNYLQEFLTNLETVLQNRDVAAIVVEAGMVTGSGLAYVAEPGFLEGIRKLTTKYGTLLILDEVGTGFGRCGELFAHNLTGVVPDILTLAKAIANGAAPMAAMLTSKELMESIFPYVNITSTFGWSPISCAAALATLRIHLRDRVYEQARQKGTWLLNTLQKSLGDHPKIGNIQGIGMEIGVTFVNNRTDMASDQEFTFKVVKNALENGLHVTCCGNNVIQIMPPLIISQAVLEEGLEIFLNSIL